MPVPAQELRPIATLDLFRISLRDTPRALLYMASHPRVVRATPGVRFAKLLGTSSGRTFRTRDTDLTHWAVFAVWTDRNAAGIRHSTPAYRAWARLEQEHLGVLLDPLHSHGTWARQDPFGELPLVGRPVPLPPALDVPHSVASHSPGVTRPSAAGLPGTGMIAAVTRARIRPRHWRRFDRAVPPVADALQDTPGLLLRVGIGEAPIGLQGTFSLWRDGRALRDFAYRGSAHRTAIETTQRVGWYSEEMFARFSVLEVSGTFLGTPVHPPTLP